MSSCDSRDDDLPTAQPRLATLDMCRQVKKNWLQACAFDAERVSLTLNLKRKR